MFDSFIEKYKGNFMSFKYLTKFTLITTHFLYKHLSHFQSFTPGLLVISPVHIILMISKNSYSNCMA